LGLSGGGGGGLAIGLAPTIPGLQFAQGGLIGDRGISEQLLRAMANERRDSGGRDPRLVVANKDEMILNPAQTTAYRAMAAMGSYSMGSAPNYGAAVSAGIRPSEPIIYRTEIINQVEYVSRAELDAGNERNRQALVEYDRQVQDKSVHSINYRSSMGLRR
jgi:hypothetical protein